MINQRREKRFNQSNKAVLNVHSGVRTVFRNRKIMAETCDICVGGARIITHKFFETGTIVRVQIELENSDQVLKIDGEVKWAKEIPDEGRFEFGLEFVHEISRTIMSLMTHLYGERQKIPATVQAAECS